MTSSLPDNAEYRLPAEWEPHEAVWVAWPSHGDLWGSSLSEVRREFVALGRQIAQAGERLNVLVLDDTGADEARKSLAVENATMHHVPFGDIWLRDTAPIFLVHPTEGLAVARFRFNGWGGKYVLPHDDQVAERVAATVNVPQRVAPWVLEGGSVDVDGAGTCLTTRQCLLHPNRNPSLTAGELERGLRDMLGIRNVLWLDDGLVNDHTDGHVDNVARFVAPGVVVCMEPRGADDPNRTVLQAVRRSLQAMHDARGQRLDVVTVPSPGRVCNAEGEVMAASSVNFYIANGVVVVPVYGTPWDDEIVKRLGALFPGRRSVGASARALLTGGGSFHCITQQQPRIASL